MFHKFTHFLKDQHSEEIAFVNMLLPLKKLDKLMHIVDSLKWLQ